MAAARTSSSRARRRPGWGVGGAITTIRRATCRFGCAVRDELLTKPNSCSIMSTRPPENRRVAHPAYAELHCHSHFSFLDGASAPDDLVARAVELGLAGLAVTDHQGLYGAVRFSTAAEAAGLHPVIGIEIELVDAAVPDPGGIVVPARRPWRPGRRPPVVVEPPVVAEGRPARPRPIARPAAGSSRGGEGGPPGDRRGAARAAPRAARPGRDGLAEPVPDGVAGEPRGDEGGPAVHAGAAGRARRGR